MLDAHVHPASSCGWIRVWLQSYGTFVCRQLAYSLVYGSPVVQGDWNMPAAISSLFVKSVFLFLPHYIIFIPFNASSDMHFHILHAIS